MYGFTSWGLISPNATGECGSAADLDFFVNVAALVDFINPFIALQTLVAASAGRRLLRWT